MTNNIDFSKATAWPFAQAKRVVKHLEQKDNKKGYALFETGYGPSGLPHIGTFAENLRTDWIRFAFEHLSNVPTKLISFSDDKDGFRKVPKNLPEQEMLSKHLQKSLTEVPDPFGCHGSLGEHNNSELCKFLDKFNFEYDFYSASEKYAAGDLNAGLLAVLNNYEKVLNIVLPTLGEERQKTYSPFLPVCPKTHHVLQVPVVEVNKEAGTILYEHNGERIETKVTDGACKLQWKADWAMRWYALDVDYEMSGKDLIDSVTLGKKICYAIGGKPPVDFTYEHWIDADGKKISKSVGNGVSMDQWIAYTITEALAYFVFKKPQTATKMFLAAIATNTDEYFKALEGYHDLTPEQQIESPLWFIHKGDVPKLEMPVTYGMLLNLINACGDDVDNDKVWACIERCRPGTTKQTHPVLDKVITGAINYYKDIVEPTKNYKVATEQDNKMLDDIIDMLHGLNGLEDAEDIQTEFYTIGKKYYDKSELKDYFANLYSILFGVTQGPRLGGFIKVYGVEDTVKLINKMKS